jgi:hypothetical protein
MNRFLVAVAASALAAVTACSSSTGRVTVQLTDSPAALDAAVVTIARISLHGEGGDVVLAEDLPPIDLLTLANSAATLIEDAVVPTGRYTELRFQITGGYVVVPAASGEGTDIYATSPSYEGLPEGAQVAGLLKTPSYAQSGLKVTMPGDALVIHAESKILLVDFDVAQSFGHDAGGSDSWAMHPVIKGADLTASGNVVATLGLASGVTLPAGTTPGAFRAVLTNEAGSSEVLPFVDAGGSFAASFLFLLPGSYTVDVTGPAGLSFDTSPAHPMVVTVGGGMDAHADFVVTAASSP